MTGLAAGRAIRTAAALLLVAPATARAQDVPLRLSLQDAINLAREQNIAAQLAGLRADELQARVSQRRADLLPALGAQITDGSRTYNTASFGLAFPGFDSNGSIIGPVRTVDVRARLGMTLYDPGARARLRGAEVAADSADAGSGVARDIVALTAAAAYLRALRADAILTARAADSSAAAQLVMMARDALAAGVGVGLDVTRAEAQLAGVRTQLAAARNERLQAQLSLRRAIGVALTRSLVLLDSLEAPQPSVPSLQSAMTDALKLRPELRAAAAGVQSARLARDAAAAARLPVVGAFVDQGYTGRAWSHLLRTYAFGLQLSVPILEGGRISGRVDEQTMALRAAELRLADVSEQVRFEVGAALIDISSASEQVSLAQERLRLAEAELAQAQDRFQAGVAGNADVITALLSLTGSRAQLIDAETALRYAHISLARAEGRLSETPQK